MQQRFQPYTRLAAIVLLVIGCLIVLRPFLAAILFAAAITISSWPLYQRLLALKQRRTIAALVMSVGLTCSSSCRWRWSRGISPTTLPILRPDQGRPGSGTLDPPAWLKDIPLVGEAAYTISASCCTAARSC
jgi:hypothetical protein